MKQVNNNRALWSIVLAGGEGTRIGSFVQRWLGKQRPKQFCTFVGTRSLLQHTLDRARAPHATVVIYPSDHFVFPEEKFLDHVHHAVLAAERLKHRIVLLGVAPDRLELDYGWILPGARLAHSGKRPVKSVRRFLEKPTAPQADEALSNNALWNTMVMTATVDTFWDLGRQCFPGLMERFDRLGSAIGTPEEARILDLIYRDMPVKNFSADLLQQVPDRVVVTELTDTLWSDWGRPERIAEALRRIDRIPAFPLNALGRPFTPISETHLLTAEA